MRSFKALFGFVVALLVTVLTFYISPVGADTGSAVKKGDKVTVEYTGKFKDGTVFDSSDRHKTPLIFEVGAGRVIKGFDDAVMGMKKGEEKEFTLQPKEAYGERNPQLMQKVARKELPPEPDPKVGMMLMVANPKGGHRRAIITEVTPQYVILDLNHPLAGKALTFKIRIADISS
ncbi:MAG: peptidylprolyl isomerase [Nitrospinaceae bacterium]